MSRYQEAQKIYKEAFGVDTEAALAKLADTMVSIHCRCPSLVKVFR